MIEKKASLLMQLRHSSLSKNDESLVTTALHTQRESFRSQETN